MDEQEVEVLARKYAASYKSLTNVWEDYPAMKLSSIETHNIKLYVHHFFIMDSCEELIIKYLGVV